MVARDLFILGGLILLGLIGIGSRFVPGWKNDNPVEELAEEVIEINTGRKVDLSPGTPDPDGDIDTYHDNLKQKNI